MAQIRSAAKSQLTQHQEGGKTRPVDESWARPPPGGPQNGDQATAMDIDSVTMSPHPARRDFSMEDLEVARALTGLRQASPGAKPITTISQTSYQSPTSSSSQEPLLSLLTSQHPLIGNAINHSVSVYNVSKQYSGPLRSSLDYVERNIASPVASTVGTAGRISGVENGMRWWLERRRSSSQTRPQLSPNASSGGHKRRRDDSEGDLERGVPSQRSRAPSDISMPQSEYLPAYDTNRSPSYSSRDPHPANEESEKSREIAAANAQMENGTWQTRLILSTSGLGVAMNHDSRRSLKYCLSWLRWANGKLGRLLYSLQTVLSEYEAAQRQALERPEGTNSQDPSDKSARPRDLQAISAQLNALKAECTKTLQSAMEIINKYAGGALPENARHLVRRHLTSLPQRFAFMASLQEKEEEILRRNAEARRVSSAEQAGTTITSSANGDGASAETGGPEAKSVNGRSEHDNVVLGARRVVVLAREGLDMMSQVSAVVDGTITSAEQWCEKLGRNLPEDAQSRDGHEQDPSSPQAVHSPCYEATPAQQPSPPHSD